MLIAIRHVTRYTFPEPAAYTAQTLRLRPPTFRGQHVRDWRVTTSTGKEGPRFMDGFGNIVELVTLNSPHTELVFEAAGTVQTEDLSGVVTGLPNKSPPRVFLKETPQTLPDDAIRALAAEVKAKESLARMHALSEAVRTRVEYSVGVTDVHTSAAEALAAGHGVCQDHAHIFIAAARVLKVPARYVTGYLATDVPEIAEAHHAWAEAWIEGLGWVGFDVANEICPTDRYVRLSTGLDADSAAPIIGSRRGGGTETLVVTVDAHRLDADGQTQTQGEGGQAQSQSQSQSQSQPGTKA